MFYVKLPADVKIARSQCKAAFDSWKDTKYPGDNETHNVFRSKCKDYHSRLRCFLNQVETDKIYNFAMQRALVRNYSGSS